MSTLPQATNTATVIERLPFRVEIASKHDLWKVAKLRASAYGRHLPALGAQLSEPEPSDFEEGCEILVAMSKLDGSALGTLRTHTNVRKALPVQASMQLPNRFQGSRIVEATRLGIAAGEGSSMVRSALFKALYMYCQLQKADWMLAGGRKPVDRIYDSMLFKDVEQPNLFYPMRNGGGIPHRVMCLSVRHAKAQWAESGHPLYGFFCEAEHPDINLSGARIMDFEWICPVSNRPV
jgi:hypothetical protein